MTRCQFALEGAPMSAIPLEKLDRIIQRFATVEHDMSSGAGGDAFVKLSKE